jgi:hypothetical protein
LFNQRDRTIAGILALLCVTGPFLSCYLVNGLWAGFGETRIAWWGMHRLVLSPTLNLMAASALLSQ